MPCRTYPYCAPHLWMEDLVAEQQRQQQRGDPSDGPPRYTYEL